MSWSRIPAAVTAAGTTPRDALARRRHARLLGDIFLSARCGQRRILVAHASADLGNQTRLRSHLQPGAARNFARACTRLTRTPEIAVSPENDVEVRRITFTNHSDETRTIEVTSYAEIVLNTAAADMAHPAFSNLFVQTQIIPQQNAILCSRRPRASHEKSPWIGHLLLVHGNEVGTVSFETDRARFIGRGGNLTSPAALKNSSPLVEHRRFRARSDCFHPPHHQTRTEGKRHGHFGFWHRADARGNRAASSKNIRIRPSPTAALNWRGRTA